MATGFRVFLGAILAAGTAAVSLQALPVVAATWDRTPSRFYQNSALLTGTSGGFQCQSLKATAGALRHITVFGLLSAPAYLQIFNVASNSSVTLSTTSPNIVIPVPTTNLAASGSLTTLTFADPITFSDGICVAATTAWAGGTTVSVGIDAIYY